MRVTQLGPFPPPNGGVQTNLVAIHERCLGRGWDSSVVNLTRFRSANQTKVHYPQGALGVLGALCKLKPQIAHLHIGGNLTPRLLGLGAVLKHMQVEASVLTLHSGGYPSTPVGKAASPWSWRGICMQQFDAVVAVNEELAAMLLRFGVGPAKLRVVPPYVLPAWPEEEVPDPLKSFFLRWDSVLISMGWLEQEYDYQLQIEVMKQVVREFPQTGLLILGEGRERDALTAQILESELQNHVLLAGDWPRRVALAALSRSRMLLRTTWYDGDAISIREALHYQVPVIATDNGMRPEGVILVAAREAEGLSRAIRACLGRDAPARLKQSANHAHIDSILDLYQELRKA